VKAVNASRWWRILAVLFAMSLVAAACGDDNNDSSSDAASGDTTPADSGGDAAAGGEINLDEEVEIAPGTVLPLPDCPSDWDPEQGLTDDTIKIAISLPESGPVAALGQIDDGMRAYFESIEPIDGRTFELVSRDDAYDPAKTLTNTEEMLQTDKPFAFTYMIGTPNNLAIRDLLDEECVPQLFNSTGFPAWGDPANYPWTIGGLLSYKTEARMWCNYISETIGEGTKVAGLFMDNDFGASYEEEVNACADEGLIELVESVKHDPAAPDVTDEITTLTASDADVILLGTTGAACPQSMAALAGNDVIKILSYTCQGVATYFKPVDPAGDGVLVAVAGKDASMADDPDVQNAAAVLEAAGLDINTGSYFTGVIFGESVEGLFRQAAGMEGGLNRVNLMRATWNADYENPLALEGSTIRTAGVDDAFMVEAAQFARYVAPTGDAELGTYEFIGDLINVEGETGSVSE
jgi:branched-chain amino acid transport system substrate-binding protein